MTHSCYGGKLETQHPFQVIEIHTEKARYSIQSGVDQLTIYPHDGEMRQIYCPSVFEPHDYGVTMTRACERFLSALCGGEALPATADDALENMMMIELLCSSMIH